MLRQSLLVHAQPYPGLDRELAALVPAHFLRSTPYEQLTHLPRYLKAMKARADRWKQNPAKDAERAALIAPYVEAVNQLRASADQNRGRDSSGTRRSRAPCKPFGGWSKSIASACLPRSWVRLNRFRK